MSERSKNFYVSRAKGAVFHQASQPTYIEGTHGSRVFNEYRDLGLKEATGGKYFAHIVHPKIPKEERVKLPFGGGTGPHQHTVDFQCVLVLRGWVRFEIEDHGEYVLHPGDFLYLPPHIYHGVLDYSDDLETFEILSPAEYDTNTIDKIPGKTDEVSLE
ncbi:MAG: cupin domain-containing protein [Rhizobiaceae bacterium]|nr:cupin domain-containing protein [Rhizobiaceae bacterium]